MKEEGEMGGSININNVCLSKKKNTFKHLKDKPVEGCSLLVTRRLTNKERKLNRNMNVRLE